MDSVEYDPKQIEPKWQKKWLESGIYIAKENGRPKWYSLIEFPYPSGEGLHTGHVRSYTAMDIISRKRRREGFDVLYPIGWDAFGLPAENFAIKTGIHPSIITKKNTDNFRRQLQALGMSFDWSREINTTDPKYYKWTQWIFLKFLEAGLAYKAKAVINWCPKDKIGLANEEVIDGKCERCGTPVEKREKEQWMLKITAYADKLFSDVDTLDFWEKIKLQQKNWIGRSEGAEISFELDFKKYPADNDRRGPNGEKAAIKVFTTRPDTIFGATYLVLAPEHPWVTLAADDNHDILENKDEVRAYIAAVKNRDEIERTAEGKEKTGVELKGVKAINPATKEEIPMWIADYVLPHYGTGAIMAVPADDERDGQFAQKFNLPVVTDYPRAGFEDFGTKVTRFKLRDWVFSRQRYWGEPIPVVHCDQCGYVPVPEKDLPVLLPNVEKYEPTDNGESPLANITEWVNTTCPMCGGAAKRETDVMPQWAGSSWYFLRYADPHNDKEFASQRALKHWMPVDWYNGGMEHTTLHLLYSRFWNKFLYDQGLVPVSEPYKKRTSQGFVLGEGGVKMSKSLGNVINPDTVVEMFGADSLRLYEMFMGPFDQAIAWSENSIVGSRRFIERVWKLRGKVSDSTVGTTEDERLMHETIKKVTEDIEVLGFNTAIASLMSWVNALDKRETISKNEYTSLILLLAPFAPHVTEEIWADMGGKGSVHETSWPVFDEAKLAKTFYNMAVQVNGKLRATLEISASATEDNVKTSALALPEVQKWLNGAIPKKVIVVLGKIVNIVV